jgi:hypothetical protein
MPSWTPTFCYGGWIILPIYRILVAQAKAENLVILSHDRILGKYGITIVQRQLRLIDRVYCGTLKRAKVIFS